MLYGSKRYREFEDNLWIVNVLAAPFIGMLLVFQQSFAVHIQGYSYIWAFIFAVGIFVLADLTFDAKNFLLKPLAFLVFVGFSNSLVQASLIVTRRLLMGDSQLD